MFSFHHNSLDSTNARARQLSMLNPGRALLVSATTQTAGRGRLGRVWQSPAGGAWFTLAYPTTDDPIVTQAAPLAVAAAVVDGLNQVLSSCRDEHALTIKWPNDVLLNNRKVCGILCERTILAPPSPRTASDGDPQSILILGVGLNVNVDPLELAAGEMRYPPTSLRSETGKRHDVRGLILAMGQRIQQNMNELTAHGLRCGIIKTVKRHLAWRGSLVTLQRGNETLHGVIMGIDGLGRLMLATKHTVEVIHSGEVTTVREQPCDESAMSCVARERLQPAKQ